MRRDFWVTTVCLSHERPGKMLEGTRITLQCVAGMPGTAGPSSGFGYEFSIRTPGTPQRFAEFAIELDLVWSKLVAAIRGLQDEQEVLDAALRLCFFWYNFMPLSRGTAAIGQIALHAILLSCGLEIEEPIPAGYQPDWDAILSSSSDDFVSRMKGWIVLSKSNVLQTSPLVEKVARTVDDALVILNIIGK